jgi:phosphoribosyl-dephospho-CoA transferase
MDALRPHDLLFLARPDGFEAGADRHGWPGWLDAAWLERAPLVVRRAVAAPGMVPVGARGLRRSERCAGFADEASIARRVTPGMLAQAVLDDPGRVTDGAGELPCLAALAELAPHLQALGLDWGPAGGAGFWLASGLPVLHAASDLDLLVRAPQPPAPEVLAALCELQAASRCRIDIQIDTGLGGFALMEYARGARVLLKTAGGPLLVADPWPAPAPVVGVAA